MCKKLMFKTFNTLKTFRTFYHITINILYILHNSKNDDFMNHLTYFKENIYDPFSGNYNYFFFKNFEQFFHNV